MERRNVRCLVVLLILALAVALLACAATVLLLYWQKDRVTETLAPFALWPTPAQTIMIPLSTLPAPTLPTPMATKPASSPGATKTASPAKPVPSQTPAPMVLTDPTLNDLMSQLANVQPGQSVRITMSETALNAEITAYLTQYPNPSYRHKKVNLLNGRLVIAGQVQLDRMVSDVEITARPYVGDCWFGVEIERVKLGRWPAPRFVADQVAQFVRQWTESYGETAPVCVQEITIEERRLIFVGVIR